MESFTLREYLDGVSERLLQPQYFSCWGDWFWMTCLGSFFQLLDQPNHLRLDEVAVRGFLHDFTRDELILVLEQSNPFPMRDAFGVVTPVQIRNMAFHPDYVRDELIICLRMVFLQLAKKPSLIERDRADWWKDGENPQIDFVC